MLHIFLQIELEKSRDELTLQNFTLKSQLAEVTSKIHDPAATYQVNRDSSLNFKYNNNNNNNIISIKSEAEDPDVVKILRKATYKVNTDSQKVRQMYNEFENKEEQYKKRIESLELDLRNQQNLSIEKYDKDMRDIERRLEKSQQEIETSNRFLMSKEEECNMLKLDLETLNEENRRLKEKLNEALKKQQVNSLFLSLSLKFITKFINKSICYPKNN